MAKIRTIKQLLVKLGACKSAMTHYNNDSRAFKSAFIDCNPSHANWLTYVLFFNKKAKLYPRFPSKKGAWYWTHLTPSVIDCYKLSEQLRYKANRIKYWPEMKKRLKQLGVSF